MITLGPFKLDKPLGRGGMGEVWRGYHISQDFPVAIKVLSPETRNRPAYVEAFQNEVKAMASLDHPAIISVMDYGFISEETSRASRSYFLTNSPYLVMELGECGSLDHWMDRLNWADTQSILLTVLDALAHAHANGVIHRDLKPQNLLLGFKDNVVKLTDFGLSHLRQDARREGRFETVWGTPAYMAPEQIRGSWRDYGPWTDLYALGCMAYELITGKPPFLAEDPADIWYSHIQEAPPRWKPRFPVPAQLERWVYRLLQKEPHQRFQRAADAAYALTKICNIHSRPVQSLAKQGYSTVAPVTLTLEASILNDGPMIQIPTRAFGQKDASHSLTTLDWGSYAEDEFSSLMELSEVPLVELTPWPISRPPFPSTWRRGSAPAPSPRLLGTGTHLLKVKAPRLIGRFKECEHIWQEIKTASILSQPRIVLLQGAPGTGKTRLMHWLAARAHELGACEIMHASYSQNSSPQDGLVPMLAKHIQSSKLGFRDGMIRTSQFLKHYPHTPNAHFKQLGRILFEREDDYPNPTEPDQSLLHLHNFQIILEHMSFIARERPLIVCIDDIHWGAEGLLFMRYAIRYAREHKTELPICFIITTRSANGQENYLEEQLMQELLDFPSSSALTIPTLKSQDFHELLGHILPLSSELAHEVERRSGGIPLFAIQLISSWVDGNCLLDEPDGFVLKPGQDKLPDNIHQLMQHDFQEVEEALHIPLLMAAALGTEIDERELLDALALYMEELPPFLLTKLTSSGIIQSNDQFWSFVHNMMRESLIRRAQEQGIWESLNQACAHMLAPRAQLHDGHCQERLANHLYAAGMIHDAINAYVAAATYALSQGQLNTCQQHMERLNALNQSLQLSPKDASQPPLYLLRAKLLVNQGYAYRSLDEAQRAYSVAKLHQQPHHMLDAARIIVQALLELGDLSTCPPWLAELERLARLSAKRDAARDHLILTAQYTLQNNRPDAARAVATEALLDAQADGDDKHSAQCLLIIGQCFHLNQRDDHAKEHLERAYKIARTLTPRHLSAQCLLILADVKRQQGQVDRALSYIQRAAGLYEKHESDLTHTATLRRLMLDLRAHQWSKVESQLEPLLQHFRKNQDRNQLALGVSLELAVHTQRQSWGPAGDALIELKALPIRSIFNIEVAEILKITLDIAPDTCPPAFRHDLRTTLRNIQALPEPTEELGETTISQAS